MTLSPKPLRGYTSAERKEMPVHTGVMLYFPDALCAIARVSQKSNEKHNPGEPLGWQRGKSTDQTDCVARHLLTPNATDPDSGELELAHSGWRILAQIQLAEEKRLVAAGIRPLSGVVPVEPDSSPVPRHGAVGTRSGLGMRPCGCPVSYAPGQHHHSCAEA